MGGLAVSVKLPNGKTIDLSPNIGGRNPVIHILDWSAFFDIALGYDLGLAEAYLRHKWHSDNLTQLFYTLAHNTNAQGIRGNGGAFPAKVYARLVQRIRSTNSIYWSRKNIGDHYDLGDAFFGNILDPSMTYSCAVFEPEGIGLSEAQDKKIDLLLSQSNLTEDDHVLDIGCGWGRLIIKAAENYGCKATGRTLSKNQYDHCVRLVENLGLQNRVNILFQDYRTVRGQFDHVYSIEMLEAVGDKGLTVFFRQCDTLLKESGTLTIQAITIPDERYEAYKRNCDFIQKYIFPGGMLPSLGAIKAAARDSGRFVAENLRSIGNHYETTLSAWRNNLQNNSNRILELGFTERDIRRFNYYFSYCEGGFASNHIDDYQIVFRKAGHVV